MDQKASDPEAFELESWLPYRFSIISNNVGSALESYYGQQFGMKSMSWRVMAVLGRFAPMSAKELAEKIAIDQVAVSRAISELANHGFLSRRADQHDRRRIVLKLSKKGIHTYAQIVPQAIKAEQALLEDLTDEERKQLQAISLKLMAASSALS